jgi:dihydroflavonol-4-reductase
MTGVRVYERWVVMERVVVTGVGGYIGRHVAAELLNSGYQVVGTVRSAARADAIREAIGKKADSSTLEFAQTDLLNDDGWPEVMKGADYVLHVASPFALEDPRDESDLIAPAVEGTTRVLMAAEQAGVRRTVLTSSIVTIVMGRRSGTFGPDVWADPNGPIGTYAKSKVLAEQAAWHLARDMSMELTTVLPGFVTGPALGGPADSESAHIVSDLIAGRRPGVPDFALGMVDVRDVARLHLKALTIPSAAGKRLIGSSEDAIPMLHLATTLRNAGYSRVPTRRLPTPLVKFVGVFDRSVRSTIPYLGSRARLDTTQTRDVANWSAGPIEPGLIELARQLDPLN